MEEGSVKVTPNRDTHEFLKEITLPSYQLAKEYELFTSVMLAQAILESASGNSDLVALVTLTYLVLKEHMKEKVSLS